MFFFFLCSSTIGVTAVILTCNLSRLEYIVSETDFFIVLKQLPDKLREVEPRVPRGKPAALFTNALTAANFATLPTNYKAHYHTDIRLYMEACLIANKMVQERPPHLLVTED